MNWIFEKAMSFALARYAAAPVTALTKLLQGHRTELATALYALTYGLEMAGILQHELAEQLRTALLGVGLVTGADKVLRYKNMADELVKKAQAPLPR